ncbi:hypothetical protein ACFL0C_00070 [Patescibacteria group bacterium]
MTKKLSKHFYKILTFMYFMMPLSFGNLAFADIMDTLDEFALDESQVAVTIYNFLFPLGVAFGLWGIIMAGYTYMTSEGRPDKVKDANDRLTQAVLGTLFIVLSLVILRLIIRSLLSPSF